MRLLTNQQKSDIYKMWLTDKYYIVEIARKFGVCGDTVRRVVEREKSLIKSENN